MNTEGFKRKLTAIFSADVEGYSRLMGEDEDSTVRTLTGYRELMSSLIEKHRGRVVDSPGDNLLAEFGSVMDAVRCAVEIQEELRIRNAELPENRKMQFRIGINLGDVIEEGDRIYGDGINVAARVEGLADGGGICISGTVYDSVRNKLSWSYDFLGEHNVKNIKEPVRVYRIRIEPEAAAAIEKEKKSSKRTWQIAALVVAIFILGAVAIWYFSFRQVPITKDMKEAPKTIAVLPFDDLSPEKDQEYFVLGLSEEILNSLAQIADLTVIAKTSSFSFQGTNKKVQEIAYELEVENILEGSVRKAGTALRVTAQLVSGIDGSHLWSKTYDRELKDIFAVQEDIATAVANELKLTLGIGESLEHLGGTDNVEAYELYLVAKGQYNVPGIDTTNLPMESIDAAIHLDPEFAAAWARKSFFHTESIKGNLDEHRESKLNAAIDAANRSIELEPNLADGYFQLGWIKTLTGDWIGAELAYGKALELATEPFPEYAPYPLHYFAAGHFKKASEFLYAFRQKNPLNAPMRGFYILNLGITGDIQGAEEECAHCEALFGKFFGSNQLLMLQTGTWNSESKEEIRNLLSSRNISIEGIDFTSPENSLSALRKYYNENPTTWGLVWVSLLAAHFGDSEFALEALEKEIEVSAVDFIYVWLPAMQEVRQLPRFKEFVKKIGLVDYWNEFGWPDLCRPLDNGDFECD